MCLQVVTLTFDLKKYGLMQHLICFAGRTVTHAVEPTIILTSHDHTAELLLPNIMQAVDEPVCIRNS